MFFFKENNHCLFDFDSRIDCLFEGSRDFLSFFMDYGFAGYKDYLDKAKENALPKYLPIFEKVVFYMNYNDISITYFT